MDQTPHLKSVFDERMTKLIRNTRPGMAHWSGSGPQGKSCRECIHFESQGYFSASHRFTPGALKPGKCKRFKKMTGTAGAAFSGNTLCCRFFEENEKAPTPRIAS